VNPFFGCEDYDTAEMAGGGTETKRKSLAAINFKFFPTHGSRAAAMGPKVIQRN